MIVIKYILYYIDHIRERQITNFNHLVVKLKIFSDDLF